MNEICCFVICKKCGYKYNSVLAESPGKREGECLNCGRSLRYALTKEERRFKKLCERVEENLRSSKGDLSPAMQKEIADEMRLNFNSLPPASRQKVRQLLKQHGLYQPPSPPRERRSQGQPDPQTLELLESFVALSVALGAISGFRSGSSIADIPYQYGYKLPGPTEI